MLLADRRIIIRRAPLGVFAHSPREPPQVFAWGLFFQREQGTFRRLARNPAQQSKPHQQERALQVNAAYSRRRKQSADTLMIAQMLVRNRTAPTFQCFQSDRTGQGCWCRLSVPARGV